MKKLSKLALSSLLLFSMAGCSMGKDAEDDAEKAKDKVEDKTKETVDDTKGTVDDVMSYFKEQGVTYNNDQTLDEFDFAAKEGRSFTVDNQNVYVYRVDSTDENMQKLINQASSHNMITANQDGVENQYGATVNGNYLMVYDKDAQLDELIKYFKGYKYKDPSDAKNATTDAS